MKLSSAILDLSKFSLSVVTITPQDASTLLELNTKNRSIKRKWVSELTRRLRAGEWLFVGDRIAISDCGVLLDGQHRLLACRDSGVPIEAVLITGLPLSAWSKIDGGYKRSLSQEFEVVRGLKNSTLVQGIVNIVYRYMTRDWHNNSLVSIDTKDSLFDACQDISGAANEIKGSADLRRFGHGSAIGFIIWAAGRVLSEEERDHLVQSLKGDVPLAKGDPIYTLRERFLDAKATKARLPENHYVAMSIKAFEAYRSGRQLKLIRFSAGEHMPEIQGLRESVAWRASR